MRLKDRAGKAVSPIEHPGSAEIQPRGHTPLVFVLNLLPLYHEFGITTWVQIHFVYGSFSPL